VNTLGHIFSCTIWGESHGEAIGCVLDGCPAGLALSESDIRNELNRDVLDYELGTPRKEVNKVNILSGVYQGKTIGTPICIAIFNHDQKSADYEPLKYYYRPGHAEYSYHKKYGIYNPYGGGRASGRIFIATLAAGAIAKLILSLKGIAFETEVEELAEVKCSSTEDKKKARRKCLDIAAEGDSSGGVILLRIKGVPQGVGSPLFHKLSSSIICAISSIGGVKGIESGLGFEAARRKGSEVNDAFGVREEEIVPLTNHAGGFLGGISTGLDLLFRVAVKPTPSISKPQKTVNWKTMQEESVSVKGRFDNNFAPRVAPLTEAMASLVLVDQMMLSGHIHPTRI
jgi:chorismate synthase